jgi:hypothetical protein
MTEEEFDHAYEVENAPACYGHPKNERELEDVAMFNLGRQTGESCGHISSIGHLISTPATFRCS